MSEREEWTEELVGYVVDSVRTHLREALKEGKRPTVEVSRGVREKPATGAFVETELDGSWKILLTVPPDPNPHETLPAVAATPPQEPQP